MENVISIQRPYLLLLGDVDDPVYAKTGLGLRQWAEVDCIGQWRFPECSVDIGLPDMSPEEAKSAGVKTVVVSVAPRGGGLPERWIKEILRAVEIGLDIANGMHVCLNDIPQIAEAARKSGSSLIDVRVPPSELPIATGKKRSGMRLLTVGTDCAVGKKYAALAITQELRGSGMSTDFRATGQTGILIAGHGIPIDSVVSDFVAGAAESLSPDNDDDHWDIIEGQGSLFHPSYAGVTLGLLHGSQPDALVLCHDIGRKEIAGLDGYSIPELDTAIELYTSLARLTNPNAKVIGICLNSSSLAGSGRKTAISALEEKTGLPCADPLLDDMSRFANILSSWHNSVDSE